MASSRGSSFRTWRRQRAAGAAVGQPVEHGRAFRQPLEHAGLAQQFQMARHARLALSEDLREIADREIALGAQRQDAQPRGLANGAQAAQQISEVVVRAMSGPCHEPIFNP